MSERTPDHEAIANRAYAIYQARGGTDGLAEEDWSQAEAELAMETTVSTDAGPNVPVRSGGRGERAADVMPDVEQPGAGDEPERLKPPGGDE